MNEHKKISVYLEDSAISTILDNIIDHPNKENLVNLLDRMISESHNASTKLIQLYFGEKLFDVIPNGTLVYVDPSYLYYDADKQKTLDLHDGKVVGTVHKFMNYHEYSNYLVKIKSIQKSTGNEMIFDTGVPHDKLKVIDELENI